MLKRSNTTKTEYEGVLYFKTLVNKDNSFFHETDSGNEVGIDGYVELTKDDKVTGFLMAIQIKSGTTSVVRDTGSFYVQVSKKHLEYWSKYTTPVVIIAYSTKLEKARWLDITSFLHENPDVIRNGPYNINIPDNQTLTDEDSFYEFKTYFLKKYYDHYTGGQIFSIILENLIHYHEKDRMINELYSIFNHRNKKVSWFVIINLINYINNKDVLTVITLLIAHITPHPDIFWSKGNIIDKDTKHFARKIINDVFKKEQIVLLLSLIDEESPIERGSLGQSIDEILKVIKNSKKYLFDIIYDKHMPFDIQNNALTLLLSRDQIKLEKKIKTIYDYIECFPESPHTDFISNYILDHVKENGGIDFY